MSKITHVIIHCSDTTPEMDIRAADIDRWHKAAPRNWNGIGYHDVICRDGILEMGRLYNDDQELDPSEYGAQAYGFNRSTLSICLIGGKKTGGGHEFNFTDLQVISLKKKILDHIKNVPDIKFGGHRQFNATHCPAFDIRPFLVALGVPLKNIEFADKVKL